MKCCCFAFVNITIIFQINIFCYIARTTNIIQLFFCNDDLFDADDEEKSACSQTFKKEPKIFSFTKEDLKTYLMSKESQDILKEEGLPNPSSFKTELSGLDFTEKYYNKAKEKINDLKKDFNPAVIKVVYEDGRNVAYPVKIKPHERTLKIISKFNTLSNYSFNMQKSIERKTETGSGIFYFNNPH